MRISTIKLRKKAFCLLYTEKSFKSGAEYMKRQIIEWLNNHFDINVYEEIGGRKAAEILTYDFKSMDDMIDDLKKI